MGRVNLPHHDKFSDYTPEEIAKITKNVCIKHKCPYAKFVHSSGYSKKSNSTFKLACDRFCDYLCIAGKSRGCMPDECTHYKDKNVKRRINPMSGIYDF